jgi:predicted DNA-binding protein (MmcQ/YjbR family)
VASRSGSPTQHHQRNRTVGREQALTVCSHLPGAELTHPFGHGSAVFKVAGKMFAAVSMDEVLGIATLKCDPDYGAALVALHDEVSAGYHMNKRHWISVTLKPQLSATLVNALIEDSYDLVVAALPLCDQPSPRTSTDN